MEELDDEVAALLLPLDDLDDLALDEALVLDEVAFVPAVTSPREQQLGSSPASPLDAGISCEASSSASRRLPNATATALAKAAKKKKKNRSVAYDSNSARNKRRHELAYLRQRVEEMQQELVRVETFGSKAAPTNGRQSVWKEIASRQFNERQRAETENQRLKAALETQLQVAKSLEALLTKRSTAKTMEDCGLGRYVPAYVGVADASDAEVFAALLKGVDEIHADAEWMVRQGGNQGFESTLTPSHAARMRPTEHGLLVEVFGTDLLPFSLSATSAAAWHYFSHGKNHLPDPVRYYYERVGPDASSDENTVLERSGFEMTGNGMKMTVKLNQALRRYVEEDRVVIAYSAIMEPVAFAGEPLSHGFSLPQWGCMVLRATTPTDGSSPLTVLQSCFYTTLEFHSDVDEGVRTDPETDARRFTECVLSWLSAGLAAWRQRIENILLDMHLSGAQTSPQPSPAVLTAAV